MEFDLRLHLSLRRSTFLVLPVSETDPFCQGVTLTILAASNQACAVKSLQNLFARFPKSHYHSLFSTSADITNSTFATKKLQEFWVIEGTIQVTRLEGEPQYPQD